MKMDKKIALIISSLFVVLKCLCGHAAGQSYSNYSSLVSTVLTGYNADIIPLDDHSQTLTIHVSGHFYSLLEVDVVLGKITIVFALVAAWTDSQIKWTPADYGNLTSISIPGKKVWTPPIVLVTPLVFDTFGRTWMPVDFTSDGSAVMALADVVSSGCSFNMKFWPFDKQTCDIGFAVYGHTVDQVQLRKVSDISITSYIINENIEWAVTGGTLFVRNDRGLSEVILRLEMERKSAIFIIIILFPLYGLAFLSSFVFLLPSDAGERIGFTTTIMLSITVFLDVISDYIPNASEPIPLLCIVVAMGLSMSIICTITTIISLHFYHKDADTPINGFFVNFVKMFNTKFRKHKVDTVSEAIPEDIIDEYESSIKKVNTKGILKNKWSATEELKVSWKDVSYTIDKMSFMGGTAVHLIVTVSFTAYMMLGTN